MQTALVNAISIIAGCLAIGLFFDFVYLTDEHKSALRELITRGAREEQRLGDTFFDYLRAIKAAIFDRHFASPFLSRKYFLNCTILSLCALVLIFAIQVLFVGLGQFKTATSSPEQMAVIAICVATNVAIDWLSIGQTKTFFAIAAEQDRVSRALLLIISDIFVTMNLFIAAFAVVATFILQLPSFTSADRVLTAQIARVPLSTSDATSQKHTLTPHRAPNDTITLTDFFVDSIIKDTSKPVAQIITFIPDLTFSDVIKASIGSSHATITKLGTLLVSPNGKINKTVRIIRHRFEWGKIKAPKIQEVEYARVHVPPFSFYDLSYSDWYMAYTAAYRYTAELQLGFPASVFSAPTTITIHNLESLHQSLLASSKIYLMCKHKGLWHHIPATVANTKKCDSLFTLLGTTRSDIRSALSGRLTSDVQIPLNTLFLTSFTMTGLLYGLLMLLFMARIAWRLAARHLSSEIYLKSPLGWAGFFIGIIIYALTIW